MLQIKRAVQLILLILAFHVVAIYAGWYYSWPLLDVPMHFMGGVAIGLLAMSIWNACLEKILFTKNLKPVWQVTVQLVGIVGMVMLVGVMWEWYEFIFDTFTRFMSVEVRPAQMGLGDTMADLFMDFLGAVAVFALARKHLNK